VEEAEVGMVISVGNHSRSKSVSVIVTHAVGNAPLTACGTQVPRMAERGAIVFKAVTGLTQYAKNQATSDFAKNFKK
jgi:hypothetical protein